MSDSLLWIEQWGVYFGIGFLIVFMFYVIWDLIKEHKVGKLGSAILFMTLGMGMFGFVIKGIIHVSLTSSGV